jgi:Peptidase A4 family
MATASLGSPVINASPRLPGGHATPASAIKNPGFAGYRRNGGGANASFNVKANFVVPRLTHCGSATRAIAPDIDVSNGKTGSGVGVFVGCYKGKPDYFPFIYLNGHDTDYAAGVVQPGDHILLHLVEGPSSGELTFQDLTHNLVKAKTGSGLRNLGFPGIGDDSWFINNAELGVPDFGTIAFSHCVVNGVDLGAGGSAQSPAVLQYDRTTKAGTLQIATGPLQAKQAFTTYFKHG